jgi:hypothetical protein
MAKLLFLLCLVLCLFGYIFAEKNKTDPIITEESVIETHHDLQAAAGGHYGGYGGGNGGGYGGDHGGGNGGGYGGGNGGGYGGGHGGGYGGGYGGGHEGYEGGKNMFGYNGGYNMGSKKYGKDSWGKDNSDWGKSNHDKYDKQKKWGKNRFLCDEQQVLIFD